MLKSPATGAFGVADLLRYKAQKMRACMKFVFSLVTTVTTGILYTEVRCSYSSSY